MSTTSIAPVESALARSETASSAESASAMIPDPTTVARRAAVPAASVATRRGKSKATRTIYARSEAGSSRRSPISRRRFCSDRRSMLASGRLVKIDMRFIIIR